ncbi:formyltransferase [Propionivibrio sp.]|uniref:formyltransferase n=1 Tax=Propionivibrio sp. TaxID=2212460 RepID=UPI003BF2248F
MSSAVVFAYHNVGIRCLRVLLAGGVDVRLVVTHEDDPAENLWFGSVRQVCLENGIQCITPASPNTPEVEAQVAALDADFLFSFYYRQMLKAPLLQAARLGAYNMHGSLLPHYRGRAPVNWAVLCGERETGATLHQMNVKPDNGPIIDQFAVPILPDDTAQEVFEKVTVAAELCLYRTLPKLIAGTVEPRQQDLSQGAYFGGRRPEDGRIDWQQNARQIHNLVRAVTRPYPGAFSDLPAGRLVLWRTRVVADLGVSAASGKLLCCAGRIEIHPAGGGILQLLEAELSGAPLSALDDRGLPDGMRFIAP